MLKAVSLKVKPASTLIIDQETRCKAQIFMYATVSPLAPRYLKIWSSYGVVI